MKITSISRKLLTRVLSFYFILTFIVTAVQIGAEYINTKNHINSELLTLEKTISGGLTRAVWELNTQQAMDTAEGLIAFPMIKGVYVTDENNKIIAQLGKVGDLNSLNYESISDKGEESTQSLNVNSNELGLFGHTFPLIFEFSGRTTRVGTVTLLSSNEVIFERIEVGIYFLIGNAMVKTAALIFLFSLAFNQLLTRPLNEMTQQIDQFDIDDPEASKLQSVGFDKNELNILQNSYNNLIDELVRYKERLSIAQQQIISANDKLDEQNLMLEQEVARKTSTLSTTMLKMEKQQRDLLEQQSQLQEENMRRGRTEQTLKQTNQELKSSIINLNKAQHRLLEAEKMASLGTLSAEVSHEVNTPIGVSITSTTYLFDLISDLDKSIESQSLSKKALNDFITNAKSSVELLVNNLNRASELIASYKQVAVDQTSDKIRNINISKYLDDIIQSLHPKLKRTSHRIKVNCPRDIKIYAHAGAISQIFTNLIINSLIHGFENMNRGVITINVSLQENKLRMEYEDNGVGVPEENLNKLFDPFFTTKASSGGTGLGTHIVQNLVTDTLNGTIEASSSEGDGLKYVIEFSNMA